MLLPLVRLAARAAQLILALFVAAYLIYFADHAVQLLGFGFPLDYGEGPLHAQVSRLLAGTPLWQLYADPSAPPFQIVNYPPVYLLITAASAPLAGSALLAGRIVSLLAALGCVAAIALLCRPRTATTGASPHVTPRDPTRLHLPPSPHPHVPASTDLLRPPRKRPDGSFSRRNRGGVLTLLLALLFLTVPVVREWAVLMRVDLLGVCLGLWALVLLSWRDRPSAALAVGAGLLLLGSLFTKPSLVAAPLAAGGWLVWQLWRAQPEERPAALRSLLILGATVIGGGGLLFGLLQWASGGWFALHVVAANANSWELELAQGFWQAQLALRWPLGVAAAVAAGLLLWRGAAELLLPPACYIVGGVAVAIGVGKVGAYNNYFIELYAGLVWLIALGAGALRATSSQDTPTAILLYLLRATFSLLLAGALLYYPPLWDANRLRVAGLIEPSPPRLAFGRYGLWADAARERELLAVQERVGAALVAEVRASGPIVFTDMPGVASAAGVPSRLQAFEARQLFDQGLASDDALLLELANGDLPLAVLDYLGNWLTPGAIEILQRRYAQDGSLGTFDLFRPVATGLLVPLERPFDLPGGSLNLAGYSLAPPLGASYEPGELLALSLVWSRGAAAPQPELTVVVQLTTPTGTPLLESERPLLYGAFPPSRWPSGQPVQHLQPLELPSELPEGQYALAVRLRADGSDLTAPVALATIAVAAQGGAYEASGQFVPASFRRAWAELGGIERAGLPLTPSVPFAWGRLQCFEHACLELRDGSLQQRPLGEQLYLAETIRSEACLSGTPDPDGLCPAFADAPLLFADLGPALSGEVLRNDWLVQWTTTARLERRGERSSLGLGRLGDESLRLPPGTPYRWP